MKWKSLLVLAVVLFCFSNVEAASTEPATFPSLISSLHVPTGLEFCGEALSLEDHGNRERLEKEMLLSLWHRPQVILWLKRSKRYLPLIEGMLRNQGMPNDLKYIAIAESALRPHVRSKKGAVGFWQFMKYTGQKYGLVIDGRVDERRSIFASTQAAIRYLKELRKIFGSWTLAAAAYNMGQERLMAEILEQGINDYYQLYLPLETQRYIFRIVSIKLILENPARYGFHLSDGDYYLPFAFEQVRLVTYDETPIRVIAQAANTTFKVIKELNPEIRGHYLAGGIYTILIPEGQSKDFHPRYENLMRNWSSHQQQRIYRVREGDNLTTIAEKFDVSLASLIIWNRLNPKTHIHPGDRLIIYPQETFPIDIDIDSSGDEPVAPNNN